MVASKKLPIVEVEWCDACTDVAYANMAEARALEATPRRNVGYLSVKNKKKVVLLWGLIDHDGVRFTDDRFVIPRGMVTKITYLEEKKAE